MFQEQLVAAADAGTTWLFEFDAKRGDIGGGTTASAFFKTIQIDPCCSVTNFIPVDMTNIPTMWDRYALSIFIDPSLEGQLLQFGFLSMASNGEISGMLYDTVAFSQEPLDANLDLRPGSCPNPINAKFQGVLPAALLGSGDLDVNEIDVASLLEGVAPFLWSYEDVAAPFGGEEFCWCTQSGPDGSTDLTLKFLTQELVDAIGSSQGGDHTLTLTGSLLDGTPIEGQDCLVYVGARPVVSIRDEVPGFGILGESQETGPMDLRDSPRKPTSRRSRVRER